MPVSEMDRLLSARELLRVLVELSTKVELVEDEDEKI
jgi:hypothetical protein